METSDFEESVSLSGEVNDITGYLTKYGPLLAGKIQDEAEPLFVPGTVWDQRLDTLLRKPFQAQGDTIMGLIEVLKKQKSAMVVGEMGTGKSLIGASVPYIFTNHGRSPRVLIMCPGHLTQKWAREVKETIPDAQSIILRSLEDVMKIERGKKNKRPEYYIISKDRAKLSYAWRPVYIKSRSKAGYYCPGCGELIIDADGNPAGLDYLKRNRRYCRSCTSPLWQADKDKLRRFAVAEYIKKYLNGYYDFLICDEVHELKGGDTAQGNAFGALASACKKVITLTGTVVGGYADDIFYILYRISPHTMKEEDIEYRRVSNWIARYGVLETVTRYSAEDNVCSRGKKVSTSVKRKPGISPLVFSEHLMEKTAFLHLTDIATNLPPITEQVVVVRMDEELKEAYSEVEDDLKKAVREALAKGSKALLGTYINMLLSYPDRPFDNEVIVDPRNPKKPIALPRELPKDFTYAKERELIELITREVNEGRKTFVYCQFTATKDVTVRLKNLLSEKRFRAEVMRSTVDPEKREEWVKEKVRQGIQVIIANPKLVQTGLDLYDFPTLIFYQTGYSVFTLRQASRRSWRIGQKKPVRVYYLFYAGTMQERAMQLMGKKMETSLAIEGKFSEEGLLAMTSGEDMTTALAKTLVEGISGEGAENIWRKLNEKNAAYLAVDDGATNEEVSEAEERVNQIGLIEADPDRVVYVDFLTFTGRRKKGAKRAAIKADEVDSVLKEEKKGTVQFSMFE